MEDLISINEEGLDKLAIDIYDYSERINNIFNQIDDLMFQSKTCFDCYVCDEIYEKYSELKASIDNVKTNISSYSTDLIKVKISFRNHADVLLNEIDAHISNVQSKYE